mgnify:CR=1 FL=1
MRLLRSAIALLVLGPALAAQVSSSTTYQVQDWALNGAGGGQASPGFSAQTGMPQSGDITLVSTGFQARAGFISVHNPDPLTLPVVFGMLPRYGDKAGGTPVTVYGLNFQPTSGWTLATSGTIAVGSGSPNMGAGSKIVIVTNTSGSDTQSRGWTYTPAVVASPNAYQNAPWKLTHYGPPGTNYSTYMSFKTVTAQLFEGTLLIGPTILLNFIPIAPYGATGVAELQFTIPVDPILVGFTIYIQDLQLVAVPPHKLTNRTQTTFF